MLPSRAPDGDANQIDVMRSDGTLAAACDEALEALVRVASSGCDLPFAVISIVDESRQRFVAAVGFDGVTGLARDDSFWGQTIPGHDVVVIEDLARDPRFEGHALVLGPPGLGFYAGCPLVDRAGFAFGTLAVFDRVPRTLTPAQVTLLRQLSTAIVRVFDARRVDDAVSAAERAATSARADLAVVLNAVAGTVGYWDRQHLNRFANSGYAQMFGWAGGSLIGLHMREVLGKELYALNLPHVEAALRGERVRFERSGVNRVGRLHWVTVYTPDVREGRVEGFVATLTDVTELNETLLTSQRRTALLQLAEEHAQVGHWRVEIGVEQVFWSPQVYRIHGRDPATFVPTVTDGIMAYHPDDQAQVRAFIEQAVARQEPFEFDLRLVLPDGKLRRVHSKGLCEVDPRTGRTGAIFGIFQDITERELLRERVERQDRLVTTGTLAAGVGHEINNPLAYVGANIDFAIDELRLLGGVIPAAKHAELLALLADARGGADRIGKIVRGLRAFARESAPLMPTDVHASIEISVNMAMHEFRGRATITTELAEVPLVLADESRLSQVFVNLLVNAAQSFPNRDSGQNRVVVRTKRLDADRVVIEVEDNGAGIPADVLPRVFDPFFTTKAIGQGTGLGLSICHSIVTALGGDLTCSTTLGQGTVFRVVIPALVGAPPPRVSLPPVARVASAGARVLVVDDDDAVLRAIARLLRGEHEVVALGDSREALQRLEAGESFDVIFCDLMMPYLTGMEVYRRVQLVRPELADRFVFITGGTVSEDVRAFLADVPNECLGKPFRKEDLRGAARRFVAPASETP